jgi:hypothetical protein
LLTSTIGWRAVYWVNVPVGIAAIVAGRTGATLTCAVMRTTADSSASLMALALHLGNPDKSGRGYAGVAQARPAFIALALVSAAAAAISLASRERGQGQSGRSREADPSGADR